MLAGRTAHLNPDVSSQYGVGHASVIKLVRNSQSGLKSFGSLGFEIQVCRTDGRGGDPLHHHHRNPKKWGLCFLEPIIEILSNKSRIENATDRLGASLAYGLISRNKTTQRRIKNDFSASIGCGASGGCECHRRNFQSQRVNSPPPFGALPRSGLRMSDTR
jgi:hypothetical protein